MKGSAVLLSILSSVLVASPVLAQSGTAAHPVERFGVGGVGGPGTAGLLASTRISMSAAPRVSFDVDLGLLNSRNAGRRAAFGGQLRWLRTERRANGSSDYGVFGVMYAREERRTDIRFPDARIVHTERVSGLTPVIGYGFDWVAANGARVGLEATGGGSESAGPRLFIKVFATWSPRY